jgi:hypothetical protein
MDQPKQTPPSEYVIRLRPEPSDVPPIIRLRRALKCLLRSFSLRAVKVEELKNEAPEEKEIP